MHILKKYAVTFIIALLCLPAFAEPQDEHTQRISDTFYERVKQDNGCLSSKEWFNYVQSQWRADKLAHQAKQMQRKKNNPAATTIVNADTLNSCASTCTTAIIKLEACGEEFPKISEEYAAIDGCTACCEKMLGQDACVAPL